MSPSLQKIFRLWTFNCRASQVPHAGNRPDWDMQYVVRPTPSWEEIFEKMPHLVYVDMDTGQHATFKYGELQ